MKIILFNGAPGSGKTESAKYFADKYKSLEINFKEPLVDLTKRFYQFSDSDWEHLYKRDNKETVIQEIGKSPRQCLIHVSEEVIKPVFGKGVFGKIIADKIRNISYHSTNTIVCGDCGFIEEVYELVKEFGIENIYLVKLIRGGRTFEGDSRRYISSRMFPDDNYFEIYNAEGLERLYKTLDALARRVL